jgi:ABC-type phosphate/phosphonate transport system substrate-binding protein
MKLCVPFKKTIIILVFALGFPLSTAFAASELILTAPPRETAAAGNKLYKPVAKYLSQLLNRKVTYKHPGNWFNYQAKMRKDKYDIIFDGPHFISWRIAHINHEVLMKLPGDLQFMVVTNAGNAKLNEGKDLIGKKVCGISPPNLSTLSFLASFENPVLQPRVKGIKGGMGKVFKAFEKKKCPAAVLRNVFYNKKLTQEKRDQLKIIFNSKALPNQAISVSSRLRREEKSKITNALLSGAGAASLSGVVKRFGGKKVKTFIPTDNKEYDGYKNYLEGVIFGW